MLAVQGQRVINPHESRWFWIVLVANPILWALASLSALLGLDWGALVVVLSCTLATLQQTGGHTGSPASTRQSFTKRALNHPWSALCRVLFPPHTPPTGLSHTPRLLPTPPAYLLIPVIGVVLGGSNLAGYFKCSKDAKKQLQAMTANMATTAMASAMTGRLQAAISRV